MDSPKHALVRYLEFLKSSGFLFVETDAAPAALGPALRAAPTPGIAAQPVAPRKSTPSASLKAPAAPRPALRPGAAEDQPMLFALDPARGSASSRAGGGAGGFAPGAGAGGPPPGPPSGPPLPRAERERKLAELAAIAERCRACPLGAMRNKLVFADGPPDAKIVFVGEAPGADEDATGIPFVGRAGQLLNKMIEAIGFKREEVYICNTLKCRPPENRDPLPSEKASCEHFLVDQLAILRPQILVALGSHAAQYLCRSELTIGKLRGKWRDYHGVALYVTYHPAFLLRSPSQKTEAWKDFQAIHARYSELNPGDPRKIWMGKEQ